EPSMGPLTFVSGCESRSSFSGAFSGSFNGAAHVRERMHQTGGAPLVATTSFNGAAHVRERMRCIRLLGALWSRTFNGAAHVRERMRRSHRNESADLRILQWGRSRS